MRYFAVTVCLLVAFLVDIAVSFKSFSTTRAFVTRASTELQAEAGKDSSSTWDGKRTPVTRMERLEQSMDASWGRGKFRTEVWAGDVNPQNDWWMAYAPSAEEVDAAGKGFNFRDAKSWFEAQGLDADAAAAEGNRVKKELFAAYLEERSAAKAPTAEEFEVLKLEFLAMNKKFFEASFRLRDNAAQAAKGQPSLDSEDTGIQWRNDKK